MRPMALEPPASSFGIVTAKKSPRWPSSNTFYPLRGRKIGSYGGVCRAGALGFGASIAG